MLSFTLINTASYANAFKCTPGDKELDNQRVHIAGYNPETNIIHFTVEDDQRNTYYDKISDSSLSDAYVQPLEIVAYLTHLPVHFCYALTDFRRAEVHKFEVKKEFTSEKSI